MSGDTPAKEVVYYLDRLICKQTEFQPLQLFQQFVAALMMKPAKQVKNHVY